MWQVNERKDIKALDYETMQAKKRLQRHITFEKVKEYNI